MLKSTDAKQKLVYANQLYENKEYGKAITLYEQILPAFSGKPQGERMLYFYGKSLFNYKNYLLASYQFERFAEVYVNSEKLYEVLYLEALCHYYLSPKYSLDQEETNIAIEKFQIFINSFPEQDSLVSISNKIVKTLNNKLAKKAFEIAKQYNQISDYKAAIKSFDNFLTDYLGNPFKVEALYYRIHSQYHLAINSIKSKREERLLATKSLIDTYLKFYPDNPYIEKVKAIELELSEKIEL